MIPTRKRRRRWWWWWRGWRNRHTVLENNKKGSTGVITKGTVFIHPHNY